jgi:hypothetical protein
MKLTKPRTKLETKILFILLPLLMFLTANNAEARGRNIIRIGESNPRCKKIERRNESFKTPPRHVLTIEETFNKKSIDWKASYEKRKQQTKRQIR